MLPAFPPRVVSSSKMIAIRTGRLEVPAGKGRRTASATHSFDRQVKGCWVALTGYWLRYTEDDHHVKTVSVELDAVLRDLEAGPGVVVEGTLLLDDRNGDDPFAGWADYLLFVELGRRLPSYGSEVRDPGLVARKGPEQER